MNGARRPGGASAPGDAPRRETGSAAPAAKLIVVGPGEAGKSTLIARLVDGAVNLAVGGRTVAMDHGMLRRAGARLSLVGVPGTDRGSPRYARRCRSARWARSGSTRPAKRPTPRPRRCSARRGRRPCPTWSYVESAAPANRRGGAPSRHRRRWRRRCACSRGT